MAGHARDWHKQVMSGPLCTVCGWREGLTNSRALHDQHLAHILGMQEGSPGAPPFDAAVLAAATQWAPRKPAKVSPGPMAVWLTKDPQTERVVAQTQEPADGATPRGGRGVGWPWRQHIVDCVEYAALLRGDVSPDEQDRIHREWWTQAAPEGVGPWPE